MEKWIHKHEVMERWGKTEPELMDLVRRAQLPGFDHNYSRVKHYGKYHIDQKEDDLLPEAVLSTRVAYFDTGDIIAYEKTHRLIEIPEPPTPQIEQAPGAADDALKKHLREAGQKGGKQSKIKKPILEAAMKFISENPKTKKKSNREIANSFCRKHNENESMTVTIDGVKWDVFASGDLIFSRLGEHGNKISDNKDKSITYTTFHNTYIPRAKNTI